MNDFIETSHIYGEPIESPVLRYSKTNIDMIGNVTLNNFLKVSIDNGKPFYFTQELLEEMLKWLKT